MNQLGRLIKHHRLLAGLSQKALAERAKVSHTTINRLEQNAHGANDLTLYKLADALGLDPLKLTGTDQ